MNTGKTTSFPTIYSTIWEEHVYSTDIIEIENYNEDERYRLLDQTENKRRANFSFQDTHYQISLDTEYKDSNKRIKLKENKSQITNSQVYVFDSYAEASQHKRENTTAN